MISEIIKQAPMAADFETDWTVIALQGVSSYQEAVATSVQRSWSGAAGDLDGTVEIFATNDLALPPISEVYDVARSDADGTLIVFLYPLFKYLKIKYHHNGNSGGYISAVLFYEKIN
ncbi:MAG: hypothetical protein ACOCX7_01280 [Bacteroidota bacterium]